MFILRRQALAA